MVLKNTDAEAQTQAFWLNCPGTGPGVRYPGDSNVKSGLRTIAVRYHFKQNFSSIVKESLALTLTVSINTVFSLRNSLKTGSISCSTLYISVPAYVWHKTYNGNCLTEWAPHPTVMWVWMRAKYTTVSRNFKYLDSFKKKKNTGAVV